MTSLYDALLQQPNAAQGLPAGYAATRTADYISIRATTTPAAPEDGWKFHLVIEPTSMAKATDVVLPILAKHGVQHCAITTPKRAEELEDYGHPQVGKQFTFHGAPQREGFDWKALVTELEHALSVAEIHPGYHAVRGDRHIVGARYTAYRNDMVSPASVLAGYADAQGHVSPQDVQAALQAGVVSRDEAYNPDHKPDPLAGLNLSGLQIAASHEKMMAEVMDRVNGTAAPATPGHFQQRQEPEGPRFTQLHAHGRAATQVHALRPRNALDLAEKVTGPLQR